MTDRTTTPPWLVSMITDAASEHVGTYDRITVTRSDDGVYSVNARTSDGNDGLTFNRLTIDQALDTVGQMLDGADREGVECRRAPATRNDDLDIPL